MHQREVSDECGGVRRPAAASLLDRLSDARRVSEAEDLVQDAFLRYQHALAERVQIESPKAYLSAVVTRLAIDDLRSARHRRETYVGQWLPEPLLTDDNPARAVEEADSLSMAFLLVLERLSPVERAVFLLHDVFAFDYDEIAAIIGKSVANCRQLGVHSLTPSAVLPRIEVVFCGNNLGQQAGSSSTPAAQLFVRELLMR